MLRSPLSLNLSRAAFYSAAPTSAAGTLEAVADVTFTAAPAEGSAAVIAAAAPTPGCWPSSGTCDD